MKTLFLIPLLVLIGVVQSISSPMLLQLDAAYRPQVKTSRIDYPYLSAWEGFVDIPSFGLRTATNIHNEWYLAVYYRYLHKSDGIDGGNNISLDRQIITVGPYYRSPTTESGSFFINLYLGIGVALSDFEMDIGGKTDKLSGNYISLIFGLEFEKNIFGDFSLLSRLNYSMINSKLKGDIGEQGIPIEITLKNSGLDIALGIGYKFEI